MEEEHTVNKKDSKTATENPLNEGFRFLKLSEFKQWKSFVKIRRNLAKNSMKRQKWHVKTYIYRHT